MQKVEIIFLPFATNRSPRYLLFSKITLSLLVVMFILILLGGAYYALNQMTALFHNCQLNKEKAKHTALLSQISILNSELVRLNQKVIKKDKFLKDVALVTSTHWNKPEHRSSDNFVLTQRFSIWEEKTNDWSKLKINDKFDHEISEKMPKKELQLVLTAINQLEGKIERHQKWANQCYKDMNNKYYRWAHTPTILPIDGVITSRYGVLRPHLGGPRVGPHKGVDIAGPLGMPVRACAAGKVLFGGWTPGYGNLVIIDHLNGYYSYYGHCLLLKVKEDQMVTRYQEIALLGSTGRSTGPHVHFEIRQNDKHMNPMHFIEEEE